MRNLKKVLALVLAMVMALSLMTVAGAVEFKDQEDAKYQEAIEVLGALDVFQGYSKDNSSFMPKQNITRAEVATIIYRIDTKDTKGEKKDLYANNDFKDVPSTHWAAGYIGYCVNKGIIKGYPDGTFKPGNNITGHEVLAMILREVGYDQKNEFSSNWPMNVATTARHVGASTTLTQTDFDTLNGPATREVVAELLFRTMANVEMVYPNALWNYRTTNDLNPGAGVNGVFDITLGEFKFGLHKVEVDKVDDWGRPGYKWQKDAKVVWDSNNNINGVNSQKTYTGGKDVATIEQEPVKEYHNAVTECDVAHDVKIDDQKTYDLIINGQTYGQNSGKYTIVATNTATKIGATGRLTEVYKDRIVMIDTFLARVTGVSAPEYDGQNHLKKYARLTMTLFDNASSGYYGATKNDAGLTRYMEKDTDGEYTYEDGTKVAVGDMILVYAYTSHTGKGATVYATPTNLGSVKFDDTDNRWDVVSLAPGSTSTIEYGEVAGKAKEVANTKQTYIYLYTNQHEVGGTTYDDALTFYHDPAQDSKDAWNWYFDLYGNLIGNGPVTNDYNYGVITRLWWLNNEMGDGTAHVSVRYMNGNTADNITLSRLTMSSATTAGTTYLPLIGYPAYSVSTSGDDILQVNSSTNRFYVTTNWATNGEKSDAIEDSGRDGAHLDVIGGHLFRFQSDGEGVITATEVAGDVNNPNNYKGLYNTSDTINTNTPDALSGGTMMMDDHTQYLIRSGSNYANYTYTPVTGLVNIGNYNSDEVDYVDVDGDNVAEYVYIIASSPASTNEVLFYYNGGRIVENVSNQTWTVNGYVDGEVGTITISNTNKPYYIDGLIRANYEEHLNADQLGDLYVVRSDNGQVSDMTFVDLDVALTEDSKPLDFSDARPDGYNGTTGRYYAARFIGNGTTNSFSQGTFWIRDAAGNVRYQYRTTANMKVPTGEFVSNMAGKDVIIVFDSANNQMKQAYIANPYEDSAHYVTQYQVDDSSVKFEHTGTGLKVTAQVQQNDGDGVWTAIKSSTKVTVEVNYTYISVLGGVNRGTWKETVDSRDLVAGVSFDIFGMSGSQPINVNYATVSGSNFGAQSLFNSTDRVAPYTVTPPAP